MEKYYGLWEKVGGKIYSGCYSVGLRGWWIRSGNACSG